MTTGLDPRPLDAMRFDNRFVADLPADPDRSNRRRQVEGAAYSRVEPTPVSAPHTLAWSSGVADLLGLSPSVCDGDDFAAVFAGNRLPLGAEPFAMAYAGHQFGNWAGQLGDGRAIAIGEVIDRDGGHQTLQLKGAGPTPYSRTADGRAVLRSSLREFVCSEAMYHLEVPTTRALSLVATGDGVVRDMLYDGHPAVEPGAVVCRVAPSFTRFGNFQLPYSRRDVDLLARLADYTIGRDFPSIPSTLPLAERVAEMYRIVCDRSLDLVIDWMRVGFVHGVLNTDNMSILGLTIDYGPYGWLEGYDPGWTPNTTDASMRRYRYGAQPSIVAWNLAQLGSALVPLVGDDTSALQAAVDGFVEQYPERFRSMTAARLGWGAATTADDEPIHELLALMGRTETDYLILHRDLADVPIDADASDNALLAPLAAAWYSPADLTGDLAAAWVGWLRAWGARVRDGGVLDFAERAAAMDALNPRYVPRNYLAQEAIDAAEAGDLSLLHEWCDVLRRPYADQPGKDRFAAKRPEWARTKVGCSMLSCSS